MSCNQDAQVDRRSFMDVVDLTAAASFRGDLELIKRKLDIADTVPGGEPRRCQAVLGGICRLLKGIGLAGAAGVLQGCSVLLLSAGLTSSDLPQLRETKTRAEFEAIAGGAVASTAIADGNQLEVYEYLDLTHQVSRKMGDVRAARAYCGFMAVLTFGYSEALCAPIALVERLNAMRKLYVTYASDGRVLAVDFDAGTPLRRSLWGQIQTGECPRWVVCVKASWDEFRQRAPAVNYALTEWDESLYGRMLEIAGDADDGRIPREEAIRQMGACMNLGLQSEECQGKGSSARQQ